MQDSFPFVMPELREVVYTQSYAAKPSIQDVKVISLKAFTAEEGDFAEIMRLTDQGEVEAMPGFHIRQINRTRVVPGAIKAWHVHEYQDELWYVPPRFQLTVGVWDVRSGSNTAGTATKFVLGGGLSQLLYLPKGVAHGMINHSAEPVEMFYFMNQQFNPQQPDEHRIHWDHLGAEFWQPERD